MAKQEKKLTGWISGDLKPVRVGFYQRDWHSKDLTSAPDYWNGKFWHNGGDVMQVPIQQYPALSQNRPWRGLARRPR